MFPSRARRWLHWLSPESPAAEAKGRELARRRLLLEVFQHREHASVVACGLQQVELSQDALHVLLHRADGEHEGLGYAGVGASLGHQREHLELARGETFQRTVLAAAGEELCDDLRVEGGAAAGNPADSLDELATCMILSFSR